jgi:hypothetical protein
LLRTRAIGRSVSLVADEEEGAMAPSTIQVNRAPVLTLWATIVAERLGHPHDTALTIGKAIAGLMAQSKGRRLGIYPELSLGEEPRRVRRPTIPETIPLMGRAVPVVKTGAGLRATVKDQPANPASVERYLAQKFGPGLPEAKAAMQALARAYPPKQLTAVGFSLYEQFRPSIPEGVRGWGARGPLDLDLIRLLAEQGRVSHTRHQTQPERGSP